MLYSAVLEVDERVTLLGYTSDPKQSERAVQFDDSGKVVKGYDGAEHAEGSVVKGMSGEAVNILKKVDEEQVERDLRKLYNEGIRVLAVVLMHAFTYPGASPRLNCERRPPNTLLTPVASQNMSSRSPASPRRSASSTSRSRPPPSR